MHFFAHLDNKLLKYSSEVETKRTVSMFSVCLNINTKAMRSGLEVRVFRLPRGFSRTWNFRSTAGAQSGMCQLARHDTVGERQGPSPVCVN